MIGSTALTGEFTAKTWTAGLGLESSIGKTLFATTEVAVKDYIFIMLI